MERSWKPLIVVLIGIAIVVAVFAFQLRSVSKTDEREQGNAEPVRTDLAKIADFPATSTEAERRERLLSAFSENRLAKLWSVDLPNGSGTLVLAAPTPDGSSATASCAGAGNLCALYTVRGETRKLLVNGNRITGFQGVEAFEGGRYARISVAFTLYDYAVLERSALDLETGQIIPRLVLETDKDDDSVSLTASGYGDIAVLAIEGKRENGRIVPTSVAVQSADGERLQSLDEATVARLAESAKRENESVAPIALHPSIADTERLRISLALYGMPFALDLREKRLDRIMSEVP